MCLYWSNCLNVAGMSQLTEQWAWSTAANALVPVINSKLAGPRKSGTVCGDAAVMQLGLMSQVLDWWLLYCCLPDSMTHWIMFSVYVFVMWWYTSHILLAVSVPVITTACPSMFFGYICTFVHSAVDSSSDFSTAVAGIQTDLVIPNPGNCSRTSKLPLLICSCLWAHTLLSSRVFFYFVFAFMLDIV
jgi:hypothetical protein